MNERTVKSPVPGSLAWKLSGLRWKLANLLAFWAAKLRRQHNYDLGYGLEGNLAAMLEDSIRFRIILDGIGRDEDHRHDLLLDVELLAQLAKASWHYDYRKIERTDPE